MKVECTVTNVPWFTKGKVYDCHPAPQALSLIGVTYEIVEDDKQDLKSHPTFVPWALNVMIDGSVYIPGCEEEAAFKVVVDE